jgi:hypothetical protein
MDVVEPGSGGVVEAVGEENDRGDVIGFYRSEEGLGVVDVESNWLVEEKMLPCACGHFRHEGLIRNDGSLSPVAPRNGPAHPDREVILPSVAHSVKVMSVGMFVYGNAWRGPMLLSACSSSWPTCSGAN